MKREVWKYEISAMVFDLKIPKGAEILTIEMQKGIPCMWVLLDTEAENDERTFAVVGTGEAIHGKNIEYIGTFMLQNGNLVFHVFEVFLENELKNESEKI